LAAQRLAHEKPGQTLQATALVHEAYLRLVGNGEERHWDGRRHFFAAAAEAMRRILVENAGRKRGLKHGGDRRRQALDPDCIAAPEAADELLAVDRALSNQPPPEAEALRWPPRGGRLREVAPVGGVGFMQSEAVFADRHRRLSVARQRRFI
jgi:RNA polymerase sigma factor (TIGR02999 family)